MSGRALENELESHMLSQIRQEGSEKLPKGDLTSRARSVGRIARLSRNVRQPDHHLANYIAGHKAKRRSGAGEEWRATTKHDRVEIQSILIDKTKVGQASCQVWPCNINLPS